MRASGRRFFGRFALVASVLGISMLGNLRVQASERGLVNHRAAIGVAPESFGSGALQAAGGRSIAAFGNDADATTGGGDAAAEDDGQLVPAIYAWDPDVRFVYFRHVSKWM